MPTILDPGTVRLSNADVLHWLNQKKAQNAADAASDKAAGRKKQFLPDNYQRALRKHERELNSRKYPYVDNPGAYAGENRVASMRVFVERLDDRILAPLEDKYKEMIKSGEKSEKDALKALEKEQDAKGLSEAELLQIYNLAPQAVEILQNIVVDWEERFSAEEMDVIVQVINEVFRCGETLPKGVGESSRSTQPLPIRTIGQQPTNEVPSSQSSANPETVKDTDTQDLSPYSLRMRLTANPPEDDGPSGEGFVGETERRRVKAMQWVGLPEVSGGNRYPLGPPKNAFKSD